VDEVSFEILPAASQKDLPGEIARLYSGSPAEPGPIAPWSAAVLSLAGENTATPQRPFLRNRLAQHERNADAVSLQASISTVMGTSEDYVAVLSHAALSRSSGTKQYLYNLLYRDVWVRTPDGWRFQDDPPLSAEATARGFGDPSTDAQS